MIAPKMIPDEVVEAAAKVIYDTIEGPVANQDFTRQMRQWELAKETARAAIAAGLTAWPGMRAMGADDSVLYLPLPQENSND